MVYIYIYKTTFFKFLHSLFFSQKKTSHETNYNQNPDAIVPYYTTQDDNEETISDRPDSYLNPVPRSPQSPPSKYIFNSIFV